MLVLDCADARITAGSFQFKVELDDGQDFREDRNLCDVLECPVGPGHINFKTVQHLPNVFIPVRKHTACRGKCMFVCCGNAAYHQILNRMHGDIH